ncbi:MAG: tetratricopeptide repeat protein [Pseudomonadota bacterium]
MWLNLYMTNKAMLWLAVLNLVVPFSLASADVSTDVGSITFPTSTQSEEAQSHFLRGATILHSFGWKQAIASFKNAQAADPDFAMAYWGESLCYNHPLLPERDAQTPKTVLNKLGSTLQERLAKAPSLREKGFIRAVDALFFGAGDLKSRRRAYMEEMRALHEAFPDDAEVAAFYALSLISAGGAVGKEGERERILAGAIGLRIFAENPQHPGAAHYTIHAFDDPVHAILALPAAEQFAGIAPAVSHARHMPSHIFIQLGMWQKVSDSNQSAYDAAVDLYEPGDYAGDMVHALDWGQYGDLQLGDLERALVWIERMQAIALKVKGQMHVEAVLPRVRARYILETQNWQTQAVTDKSSTDEMYATGISAVRLGNLDLARQASEALAAKVDDVADRGAEFVRQAMQLEIMSKQLQGAILIATGTPKKGLELLAETAGTAERLPLPRGAPMPLKPAHEFYGEALLEANQPAQAAVMFETSLQRMPNRPRSLLGLARAQSALGNLALARDYYERVAALWQGRQLPELKEVSNRLAAN